MTCPFNTTTVSAETAELIAGLERCLNHHFGAPRRVTRLHRQGSPNSSSFAVEMLEVSLGDGTVLSLVFKDLGPRARLPHAREVKPGFLYEPRREIATYRSLLARHALGTPGYYGCIVDPAPGRYWLFLENVPATMLWQVGEFETWVATAKWLAKLHNLIESRTELAEQAQAAHWLRYDADYYRVWIDRALSFVRASDTTRRALERLSQNYDAVIQRLRALPVTFIHGELYPSNVLIQHSGDSVRICPVDWEMAAIGPGLMDLAALSSGNWNEKERAAMAYAYRTALRSDIGGQLPFEEFLEALDVCALHCAIQWLGWAPGWKPPPEQSHDWLGQALGLARKLELL